MRAACLEKSRDKSLFSYACSFALMASSMALAASFTGTHSQNDGSGTGNSIAAGIDERAAGQAIGAIGDDAAVLIGIQAGG